MAAEPEGPAPCAIEWVTIPAPDLAAARTFYGEVFGFHFSDFSPTFVPFRAANLGGALDQGLEPGCGGIGFSITVPDMQVALEAVARHGGEVLKPPYEIAPGAGSCAVFTDPNGNRLELYAGPDPAD